MKAWRGVPVRLFVFLALCSSCGPAAVDEGVEAAEVVEAAWAPCGREPRRVADIGPRPPGSKPESLVHANGLLFFSADDGVHGRELWVSNGDAKGTRLVRDVNPARDTGSTPRLLTPVGKWVFFVADDGEHGPELWRSDGTAKGTVLVADVNPGAPGSGPESLTEVDGTLFFTAYDRDRGRELWRSDGTAKGTVLVREFAPGPASLHLEWLMAWDGQLVLVAREDAGPVLWATDRKQGAMRALLRAPFWTSLLSPTVADQRLFFLVDSGMGGADLWVSWGQAWTTFPLRYLPGEIPAALATLDGEVYFPAGGEGFFGEPGDPRYGGELWRSDGTVRGTRLVKDIQPGAKGSLPSELVVVDRRLYFSADDGALGRELWRSDGTAKGTVLVKDVAKGRDSSDPRILTATEDWLFFSASTPAHGREAYFTDGSRGDTWRLKDVAVGPLPSNPHGFVRSGWDIFFVATDAHAVEELWALPFRPGNACREEGRR